MLSPLRLGLAALLAASCLFAPLPVVAQSSDAKPADKPADKPPVVNAATDKTHVPADKSPAARPKS